MKKKLLLIFYVLSIGTFFSVSSKVERHKARKKNNLYNYFRLNQRSDVSDNIIEESDMPSHIESAAEENLHKELSMPIDLKDTEDSNENYDMSVQVEDVEDEHQKDDDQEMSNESVVTIEEEPIIHRIVKTKPVDTQVDELLKDRSIDINRKKEATVALVNRAVEFFNQNDEGVAFNRFSHTKDFVDAELYIFGFTQDGVCIAHPQMPQLLWKNLYNSQDSYGRYPVRGMIEKAQAGGGWITYEWEGSTKLTYVKLVSKDNKHYVLGAGFYSHSKKDSVVNLVKSAVLFFKNVIKRGFSPTMAFSAFTYPVGSFVHGDLYISAIGFDGITYANSDNPGLVGANVIDEQDAKGLYINQNIIAALQNTNEGIWLDCFIMRAQKRIYAEKVKDKEGKEYFIACGYYPDANREQAIDLVRKAYTFMKTNGKSVAVREFSDQKKDDFRYGDLSLFVYSIDGECIAHGNNPSLIGKNRIGLTDSDGRYYVKEFIQKAKDGGGWVNYKVNKLYRSVYVELIDMGVDQFVIGCGLYPISKQETMILMVKSAISFLESSSTTDALREFVKRDGKFRRGDLSIFALQDDGICLAYGDEYDLIWRNLMQVKDDNKAPFVREMIQAAKQGPGLVKYKLNKAQKISYVESITKGDKTYIIGSGYYI